MFLFMTHNEALMWSRFERLIAIVGALLVVFFFESMGSNPTWIITSITVVIGELLALKCWIDMIRMSQPDQNCWAFKG
jgi:hypothetical protein